MASIQCLVLVLFGVNGFGVNGDIPINVVVVSGDDKVLNCAGDQPFRWYRYPPSNPTDDKVLFMGSRLADNIDERFRVLREPVKHPYQRLDFLITDIQVNHFGTYKCMKPKYSQCAELIVLSSQPDCKAHLSQLTCEINATKNSQPRMECVHQNSNSSLNAPCGPSGNGLVTCSIKVPNTMRAEYICTIRIKHKPLFIDRTCTYASNEPSYYYTWQPPSEECVLIDISAEAMGCIIALFVFVGLTAIIWTLRNNKSRMGRSSR